jgi:hypothetical protein
MVKCGLSEKTKDEGRRKSVAITAELRDQIVDLLADELRVWQVADRVQVDRREVAWVKEHYYGRILEKRHAKLGQKMDGTPKDSAPIGTVQRARTLYCGGYRRISLKQERWNDTTIRVTLDTAWTDEALGALCWAMSRMSCQALDALAKRIREG